VSILQQTRAGDVETDELAATNSKSSDDLTVLEAVVDGATAKSELEHEINCMHHVELGRTQGAKLTQRPALSAGVDSTDPYGPLRAVRKLRYERMQKRLFVLDKDARLRSGARGLQARKALVEYEKAVAQAALL
jgi:hypothetical protein